MESNTTKNKPTAELSATTQTGVPEQDVPSPEMNMSQQDAPSVQLSAISVVAPSEQSNQDKTQADATNKPLPKR